MTIERKSEILRDLLGQIENWKPIANIQMRIVSRIDGVDVSSDWMPFVSIENSLDLLRACLDCSYANCATLQMRLGTITEAEEVAHIDRTTEEIGNEDILDPFGLALLVHNFAHYFNMQAPLVYWTEIELDAWDIIREIQENWD